jgi:hypothetical protein
VPHDTPLAEYGERPSEKVGPCLGRPGAAARERLDRIGYSMALTASSTTFFASPNTIMVLSM